MQAVYSSREISSQEISWFLLQNDIVETSIAVHDINVLPPKLKAWNMKPTLRTEPDDSNAFIAPANYPDEFIKFIECQEMQNSASLAQLSLYDFITYYNTTSVGKDTKKLA